MTCMIQPTTGKIDNKDANIPTMFPANFVLVVNATTSDTICRNNIMKSGNPVKSTNIHPKTGIAIHTSSVPTTDLIM